jgi:hypothetical protein
LVRSTSNCYENDLASAELWLTTFTRLAHKAGRLSRSSQPRQNRVFREHVDMPGKCDKKKYGAVVHSRFAGQELDLICNHNFV